MHTLIYAVYPKEGMDAEAFRRHLTEVHSAVGARLPGLRRYEQLAVRSSEGTEGAEPGAFVILQFDSEADFEAATASPEMEAVGADAPAFARHFSTHVVDVNRVI